MFYIFTEYTHISFSCQYLLRILGSNFLQSIPVMQYKNKSSDAKKYTGERH